MTELLQQLSSDANTNAAVQGVVALALLDFLLGTIQALKDKVFAWNKFADWITGHLWPVIVIVLVLAFGRVVGSITIGDVEFDVLTLSGLGAAATYAATTLASILSHLRSFVPSST